MPSRINPRITGSLALLLASTALSAVPAVAQDVGTAAAVNPLSQSTPPGGETRVLRIGARVVHKERVLTTAEGTVQLLFIDKTTLNIGPNSNLVIDKFVYDPSADTGQIVTSLTKGALRFVGGQLSHQGGSHRQHTCCHDWHSRGGSQPSSMDQRAPGSSMILAGSVSPMVLEPLSLGAQDLPSW